MATLDLTTQTAININVVDDGLDGTSTMTFYDGSGSLQLGTLRIETPKMRSLLESLGLSAKAFYPHSSTPPPHIKTVVDVNTKAATTEFR